MTSGAGQLLVVTDDLGDMTGPNNGLYHHLGCFHAVLWCYITAVVAKRQEGIAGHSESTCK